MASAKMVRVAKRIKYSFVDLLVSEAGVVSGPGSGGGLPEKLKVLNGPEVVSVVISTGGVAMVSIVGAGDIVVARVAGTVAGAE